MLDVRFKTIVVMLIVVCAVLSAGFVNAQEPEPPFTWKGDGSAWMLGRDGVVEITFDVRLHVDSDGTTTGEFSGDDGEAIVERMFFEADEDGARKVYLILSIEEDGDNTLVLLNLRVLRGVLIYGEVMMKELEADGELEKGLGLGDKVAQEIYPDYLPSALKKALKTMTPRGFMKATGQLSPE